ncbi:MAG: hypothetical protein ABIZ72_11950 [Candidatus Limnocylindrales bacterium]
MAGSPDPLTRATRRAANVAASAVALYAVVWALSTQVEDLRASSPFAEDPWDAVASYAAIFLPVVAGATWIRSLRHRSLVLPARTARRIRWGAGLAAAIVLAAAAVDLQAIVSVGFAAGAGTAGLVVTALVGACLAISASAIGLIARAAQIGPPDPDPDVTTEPDLVEDLLALAADVSRPIRLRDGIVRVGGPLEAFLERSRWSPRRHRIGFGVVAAAATGVAYAAWHVFREGPSPNPGVLVVFAVLFGAGVLAAYLGTVAPLRLLRPPRS